MTFAALFLAALTAYALLVATLLVVAALAGCLAYRTFGVRP